MCINLRTGDVSGKRKGFRISVYRIRSCVPGRVVPLVTGGVLSFPYESVGGVEGSSSDYSEIVQI